MSGGFEDANAAELVEHLKAHPEDVDAVEEAENARESPRLTVIAAIDKARETAEPEPNVEDPPAAPEPDEVEEPDEVDPEPAPEPDPEPVEEVMFVCDQWAGVSLHGKNIKFENHRYSTSDPRKIAVLDAWEHARREA